MELILSSFAGGYELRSNESSQGFTRKAFGLHIQEIFPVKEDSTDTETTHFADWLFTADLNLAGEFSFNSGKNKIGSNINSVLADVASAIPGEVFEDVASSQTDESLMLSHVIYLGRNLYAVPGLDIEGTSAVASLVLSVHLSPSKALVNFSRPVEFIFQKSSVNSILIPTFSPSQAHKHCHCLCVCVCVTVELRNEVCVCVCVW